MCQGDDLAAYIQFYNDWHTHCDRAKALLVVPYEDMKLDTFQAIQQIADFLELSVTSTDINESINYASFRNMRKMEVEGSVHVRTQVMSERDVTNPESFKVRRGAVGGYRAELSPESIAFVDRTVLALLNPVYGYCSS